MQAPAQILMELKDRRRTILCAASPCFPILLKLPLPVRGVFFLPFSFLILPFLLSSASGPKRDNVLSLFLSCLEIFASLLAVTAGAKAGQ